MVAVVVGVGDGDGATATATTVPNVETYDVPTHCTSLYSVGACACVCDVCDVCVPNNSIYSDLSMNCRHTEMRASMCVARVFDNILLENSTF